MKKIAISILMLSLMSCDMFEKQERLVLTVKSKNGKLIKVYYVATGVTTNEVIQVRKVTVGEEALIGAYEHNCVNAAKFIGEDSLLIVLSDTTTYGMNKRSDTIKLAVK